MNYYRLQLTDASGAAVYSNVVALENEVAISSLGVFPNPVQDVLTVVLPEVENAETKIRIYTLLGRMVYEQTLDANVRQHEIPMTDFNAGTYFILVNQGDEAGKVQKIFKD